MEKIYIGLVDTHGIFASIIRRVIKQDYIHVVLGMDEDLDECYSVGRRNPSVPIFAGFEREDKEKVFRAFPTARYMIFSLEVTPDQKEGIRHQLQACYRRRFSYHYCLLGLPFVMFQKEFFQKGHYTCSSFIARVLEENGKDLFGKHFSLVTPRDFYELAAKETIFEGELKTLVIGKRQEAESF